MVITIKALLVAVGWSLLACSPIALLIQYRKYKLWFREKFMKFFGNKKHHIKAHILNKEGCISSVLMEVKEQTHFSFQGETYMIDKEAIWHEYHGEIFDRHKKQIENINQDIQININRLQETEKEIFTYEIKLIKRHQDKIKILEEQKEKTKGKQKGILTKKIKKLKKDFDIIKAQKPKYQRLRNKKFTLTKKIKELQNEVKVINILSDGSGTPNILYIDKNPMPIKRKEIFEKIAEPKWNSIVVENKAKEKVLLDVLTPENDKTKLIVLLLMVSLVINVLLLVNTFLPAIRQMASGG